MRRLNDFIVVCMIMGLLLGAILPGGVYADTYFDDIKGHDAEKDIFRLSVKGMISGVSNSKFEPKEPISRIDAVCLIMAVFEDYSSSRLGIEAVINLPFKDVDELSYRQKRALNYALSHGVIKGKANSDFRGEDSLTRAEASAIIVRVLGYEGSIVKNGSMSSDMLPFSDKKDIPDWAVPYIRKAFNLGFMRYSSDRDFEPERAVTRAEMAVMAGEIDRLFLNHRDDIEHSGRVLAVRTMAGYALHMRLDDGRMRSFRVADDVRVFDIDEVPIEFKDIKGGDKIEFLVDRRGRIVYIGVADSVSSVLLRRITGRVTSFDSNSKAFRLRPDFPMGDETLVKVFLGKDTVVLKGGKIGDVSDISRNANVVVVGDVRRDGEVVNVREVLIGPLF